MRSCLRSSLDDAQRQDAGLRIRLRLAGAPELNDLPWEFLLHPVLDRFLALSTETPLVRYLDLPERIRPLGVKPPLEVLAVISSPTDCVPLDVEAEWRKLQESLDELQEKGLLVLRRLESPTLPHLQRWLRKESCHILHFIGHGGFNPTTEDGLLLFSDERGRGREVSGQALGTLLHDHRPLRLAVLNACEGARASRSDPFAGVAQNLIRQGIPAVVAMQFEITDRAAISFAHELYSAVVDGYPIDAALAEARKALYFAGHELEWGTPVLYMRSPDGRIFDIETVSASAPVVIKAEPAKVEQEAPRVPRPVPAPVEVKPAPVRPPKAEPLQPLPLVAKPSPPPPESLKAAPKPAAVKGASVAPVAPQPAKRRWRGVPAALSLLVLLGLAGFVASRLSSMKGAPETQTAVVQEDSQETSEPQDPPREAGVYLTTQVQAGEKVTESTVEAVEGEVPATDAPRTLLHALDACFTTDLDQGHKLTWDDLSRCQ